MKSIGFYENDFLLIKQDYSLVKEELKRLLLTIPGERVGNTNFGSRLRTFLFETSGKIQNELLDVLQEDISNWLPILELAEANIKIKNGNIAQISLVLINLTNNEAFDYDLSLSF